MFKIFTQRVFVLREQSVVRFKINYQSRKMSNISKAAYGSWKSPISSKIATESAVGFQEIHLDRSQANPGCVWWSEMRYDEGGRYVVCSASTGEAGYSAWTPKEYNARTSVHEYGGGSFQVSNGKIFFSNFKDQRLYVQDKAEGSVSALIAEDNGWRYADADILPQTGNIYCVREDHGVLSNPTTKEAQNTIVVVEPSGKQHVLASGCNFYSNPRVSKNGNKIAWIQWNHPNMPWDTTELYTAELEEGGVAVKEGTVKKIAGGNNTSVMQPRWTSEDQLLFIGDQTDWWNIYLVTNEGEHKNLRAINKEIGGPQWVFGRVAYDLDPNGSPDIVTTFGGELGILNMLTGDYRAVDTGFVSHSCVQYSADGNIYCEASSPVRFPCVIKVNIASGKVDIVREAKEMSIDPAYFSVPEEIQWSTTEGDVSYGYLYKPQNKDFTAPDGTLPPLLVKCHGGPTSQASKGLSLKIQYFTSRGMAVLDVNYRGSTGYGKQFRHSLRQKWGVYDVADAASGAQYLADQGIVDGNKLCIDGGSAGGYTTLACLAFTDVFKAGASHYGVADIAALVADTHKFESRYIDNLIGIYNDENKHVYEERSPLMHVNKINSPTAFFQGDEDKIVPPNQAEMMYKAVKEKGLPCVYVLFQGEQHGFRKAENVQKALDGQFYFFARVFGYEPADKHCQLDIENLKGVTWTGR